MTIIDWLTQALLNFCGLEATPLDPTITRTFLDWMEQSAVGICVAQTSAGYYILLAFHAMGLAMIVGALMIVDLRVFGIARGISAQALPKFVRIGWWGFWINAISGIGILFSEANKMYPDVTFRWKLFLILIGMITTTIFNKTVLKPAAAGNAALLESSSAKGQAVFSMALWLAVIITGRMIAYLHG